MDSTLRLPLELMHTVFENADKPSLSACTLVSHTFLEIARPYLFRTVSWNFGPVPPTSTFGTTSSPRNHIPASFQLLAEFLDSNVFIALLIYEVNLETMGIWHPSELNIFVRVLRNLPRLHTLSLVGLPGHIFKSANGLNDLREMCSLPVVPRLKTFRVEIPRWDSIDVAYILCLFGAIDHLSFGTCAVYWDREELASAIPLPQLHFLDLCNPSVLPVLRMSFWSQLQDVPKMKLPLLRTDDLRLMQDFITSHSRVLQHLQLSITTSTAYSPHVQFDEPSYSIAQDSLDLSHASRLETVMLPLRMYHAAPSTQHQQAPRPPLVHAELYGCLVATLATAPRSVRAVAIALSASVLPRGWETWLNTGPPGADGTAGPLLLALRYMERLEDVCVRKAFRSLEIRSSPGERLVQGEKQWLEEALPMLVERGVLRIV